MKTCTTNGRKSAKWAMVSLLFIAMTRIGFAQDPGPDSAQIGKIYEHYALNLAPNLNMSARAIPIESINSNFSEYKPALTLHGNRLYFSRARHPENTGGREDKEDIWYADIDKANDSPMTPKRLEGHLNNSGPNFVSGVSVTGDTIMLGNTYDKKGKMKAGISYSVNENGVWSLPKTIHIKNDYNLSEHGNAYVSLSGGVIISAVQRAETYGQRDLYISFWGYDHATEPVNMGSVINSNLDESSPFLSADKKTLYFASKGHHGYGGYDIYMSHRLDETWTKWSEPENLGPAINGPLDEEFFTITHCKQWGYFSKQVGEDNVDIYKILMADLFGGSRALFR
jgi:OOP family OmpA-OmpF porin